MSMALWVHTLEGRQLTSHEDDHILMQKFTPALDAICTKIKVPLLSSFCDYTDAKANMSEDIDESEEEKLDPETGWPYGIDDMTWFPAVDGLSTLTALRACLAAGDADGIAVDKMTRLIAELDSCIAKLTGPASRGARFHLALVM
jgi:hypothetical protein